MGAGTKKTMLSVFPHVTSIGLGEEKNLWILIGSDHPVDFDRERLLAKLDSPPIIDFMESKVGIDVAQVRQDVKSAAVETYSQAKDGKPT